MATSTPREIDTQLADLYHREARTEQAIATKTVALHNALGERPARSYGGKSTWPTTDEQALATARVKAAAGETTSYLCGYRPFADLVTAYDTLVAELAEIAATTKALHAEFTRRGGWTRFFVVQSHNGHVHSSMDCSTCNRNGALTRFGWNPDLSGLTEAEAVAKLGPRLCTVCFPSAPVEWTIGTPAATKCPGSGRPARENSAWRLGMKTYGKCSACPPDADSQIVLAGNRIRAHKPTA